MGVHEFFFPIPSDQDMAVFEKVAADLLPEYRTNTRCRPLPNQRAAPKDGPDLVLLLSGRSDLNRRPQRPEISRSGLRRTHADQNPRSECFADGCGLVQTAAYARWGDVVRPLRKRSSSDRKRAGDGD